MKHHLIIYVLLIVIPGCRKSNNLAEMRSKFAGKWEYENYSGYPFDNRYSPAGNGQYIILGKDGSFERRLHDSLIFRGTYSLEEKPDCLPAQSSTYFSTNETSYSNGSYIGMESNKLTLTTSNCLADGGTVFYRRVE